jgi:hypothetical protein
MFTEDGQFVAIYRKWERLTEDEATHTIRPSVECQSITMQYRCTRLTKADALLSSSNTALPQRLHALAATSTMMAAMIHVCFFEHAAKATAENFRRAYLNDDREELPQKEKWRAEYLFAKRWCGIAVSVSHTTVNFDNEAGLEGQRSPHHNKQDDEARLQGSQPLRNDAIIVVELAGEVPSFCDG